jgi:hypothetical protein
MGNLLSTVQEGDRLATLYRQGIAAAVVIEDRLMDLGFCGIDFQGRNVIAWLNGIRFDLPGDTPLITEGDR